MCGICGQYHFKDRQPVARATVEAMTATLVPRGPDDEGYFFSGALGLGFRRLSIIDLEGGHQPMADRGGVRLGGLQRGNLQLPRAAPRAGGAGSRLSHPLRHRSDPPWLQAVGRRGLQSSQRHVRPGPLGRAPPAADPGPRRHGHQAGVLPGRFWIGAVRVGAAGHSCRAPGTAGRGRDRPESLPALSLHALAADALSGHPQAGARHDGGLRERRLARRTLVSVSAAAFLTREVGRGGERRTARHLPAGAEAASSQRRASGSAAERGGGFRPPARLDESPWRRLAHLYRGLRPVRL